MHARDLIVGLAAASLLACTPERDESVGNAPPPGLGDEASDDGGNSEDDDGSTGGDDGDDGGEPMPDVGGDDGDPGGDDGGDTEDDGGEPDEPPEGGYPSELPLVLTGLEVPGDVDLGLATNPQTKRNPGGLPDEQRCFDLINIEREKVGKAPFKWDGDLVDLARSHSEDMYNYGYLSHGSSTNDQDLYQERAQFLGLKNGKFGSVVECAGAGDMTPEGVVAGWMGSEGHRAVLLGEGYWAMNEYMACSRKDVMWSAEFGAR